MLESCHAYVAASTSDLGLRLVRLARRLGFASASRILGPGAEPFDHAGHTLSFFLVHEDTGEDVMGRLLHAVRGSHNDGVRFAPVVVVGRDGSYERTMRFFSLGYDDVVSLPERRDVLAIRLSTHINAEIPFFETATYFGPERRRDEYRQTGSGERRSGLRQHLRHTIVRRPGSGVIILAREQLGATSLTRADLPLRTGAGSTEIRV